MASPFEYCFPILRDKNGKILMSGSNMDCSIMENPQRVHKDAVNFLQAQKDDAYKCIDDKVKRNPELCCELSNYGCASKNCDGVKCGGGDGGNVDNPGKFDENCENPFQYCSNSALDADSDESDIIQSCCGSQTNQDSLSKFNNSCDTFFKYVPDTPTTYTAGQIPLCQEQANNPAYAAACKYCSNAPNFDECAIKYIDQILQDSPDQLDNVCSNIDIDAAGGGTSNSTSCSDSGFGKGCFLCKYCNRCGAYNSEVCKGVVHSGPNKNNNVIISSKSSSDNSKKKRMSNIDIALIVVGSLLVLSLIYLLFRKAKK